MTVISGKSLTNYLPVTPFFWEKKVFNGRSYGVSHAGYDIRIAETVILPPGDFRLASSVETFHTPRDLVGVVHDKSTNIRLGLSVFNTVIEPGWNGTLTLELKNQNPVWKVLSPKSWIVLKAGTPIAQVIYHKLDKVADGYEGKYQNQEQGAQVARFE